MSSAIDSFDRRATTSFRTNKNIGSLSSAFYPSVSVFHVAFYYSSKKIQMSDLQVEFLQRLIKINSWSLQRRQEEEKLLRLQRELRSRVARVRYLMCTLFRTFLDCFMLLQIAIPDPLRRPCPRHYLNDYLKGSSKFSFACFFFVKSFRTFVHFSYNLLILFAYFPRIVQERSQQTTRLI
jgi:hypothetical protein